MEYEHKTLEELNLLNRFLFAEAIEIPEFAQAKPILSIATGFKDVRTRCCRF